jgi:hypothetical protein
VGIRRKEEDYEVGKDEETTTTFIIYIHYSESFLRRLVLRDLG